jgi:hypothetical protein
MEAEAVGSHAPDDTEVPDDGGRAGIVAVSAIAIR